jgi:hypothetical protein
MRANRITAAIAVSLFCALSTASCVQSPYPSEANGVHERAVGTENEGSLDFESEPPDGAAVPQGLARDICYAAAGGLEARREFCRSALVEPTLKQSCWAHTLESRVKWIGWCSWYF